MSSAIASKNLYDLLGNDPELDPDREPEPPTKAVDKPVQRTGKRNAGAEGPAGGRGGQQTARGDLAVNNRDDGLRSDRNANRTREPREYRGSGEGRGGRGRGRGRGGRGGAPRDDRHSHTGIGEQEKQAAHGWGANDGNAEWADENAGEAIAQAEAKNESGFTPDTSGADPAFGNGADAEAAEEAAAEPEEKTKSYDEYLAELAEKKLALGENLSVRKPNEGSKQKFPEGKAFSRETEDFFVGGGGKAKKVKEAGDKKERVALDGQYYQAPDAGGDRGGGGRGRGRGGRGGRGDSRGGDRGRGGRGRGGDFRGGARGDRAPRGGGGGGFNANDESAFPALGA